MQEVVPQYQPQDVTAQAPRVQISPFLLARSGQQVGEGLQRLGGALDELGVPLAEEKGAQDAQAAVTRAPDGTPQVETPQTSFLFGRTGDAYGAAVQAGETARLHTMMQSDFADMASRYQGDPDGFKQNAASYVQNLAGAQSSPIMQQQISGLGNELAVQHYAGLVDQKARADVASSQAGLLQRKQLLEDQMDGLAAQNGGTDTPQFKQWQGERDAIQSDLQNNPLFHYDGDSRKVDDDRFNARLQGSAIAGAGRRMFQQTGDAVAARNYVENQLSKVDGLDEVRKLRLLGEVTSHLQGAQALQAQVRADLVNQARGLAETITTTGKVDDNAVDSMITSLRGARAYSALTALETARDGAHIMPTIVGGTAEQAVTALQRVQHLASSPPVSASPVGGFNSAVGRTLGFEGGLNRSDTNGTPSNFGINQAAHPGVDVHNLTPDQAKAIYKSQYWDAIGGDELAKSNPALAHVAFDTAVVAGVGRAKQMIAESGGDAGKFMDLRESYLNGLLTSNPAKYSKYASAWSARDAGLRADIGVPNAAPAAYKALDASIQKAYDARTNELWSNITKAWDKGFQPTDQEIHDLGVMAPFLSDDKLRQQIGQRVEAQVAAAKAAGYPVSTLNAMAQTGKMLAQEGKLDSTNRLAVGLVDQAATLKRNLAKEDPANYALRYTSTGTPLAQNGYAPIPFGGDPAGIASALKQRHDAVAGAKALDPAVGDNPLTTQDRQGLVSALQSLPGQQADATLKAINGGLTGPEMNSVLSDKALTNAITGMARSGDPARMNAAFSFMDAQYRRDPLSFDQQFGGDAARNLRIWQTKIGFETHDQAAQDMLKADDPDEKAARASLKGQADVLLKGQTPSAILAKIPGASALSSIPLVGRMFAPGAPASTTPGLTAAALKADYDQNFRDMYEQTGDKSQADQWATEKVAQKWGVSDLNGGRVMAYPPEKYVPQIDGSYDWMRKQFEDDWSNAVGSRGLSFDEGHAMIGESHALVSDRQTQADIAAHRPPSYQVVYTGADGMTRVLMTAPGSGVPLRWRPDPAAARSASEAAFEAKDKTARAMAPALAEAGMGAMNP